MNRRALILSAAAALVVSPATAQSAAIPLAEVSRYFNTITTAESEFTQINPDGTIATGKVLIHRPGRMRFEYDPPVGGLVVAGGQQVAIFDPKSSVPHTYPLRRTPLNLILGANIDLTRDRMVTRHYREGESTVVVAQDPEHPEYGNIRLLLTGNPTELRQWRVTDDMGRETTVILGGLRTGMSFPTRLFSIEAELAERGRY